MRTTLLMILCFGVVNLSFAQFKKKNELDSVNSTERAKSFLKTYKRGSGEILTFNEEKHKTRLAEEVLKLSNGATKVFDSEIENVRYKVLEKTKIPYYRVNYIMLDGSEMRMKDIQNLRSRLIKELDKGVSFKALASRFSMDMSRYRGGDSGWITFGDMLPEFETQVMNDAHQVDDVYLVDVESNRWYYVVQKTYDMKYINEVKVLKLVESKK